MYDELTLFLICFGQQIAFFLAMAQWSRWREVAIALIDDRNANTIGLQLELHVAEHKIAELTEQLMKLEAVKGGS